MSREFINQITNIVGFMLWLCIIPAIFIVKENIGVIIFALVFAGIILVYFKNNDAQALLKNYLDKFSK